MSETELRKRTILIELYVLSWNVLRGLWVKQNWGDEQFWLTSMYLAGMLFFQQFFFSSVKCVNNDML